MIVVVGAMSSGNRILRDVIQQSGLVTVVDTSHGLKTLPKDNVVVVIERNPSIVEVSALNAWGDTPHLVDVNKSRRMISKKYSDKLHVSYEDLCDDPDKVISQIAEYIGVEPWENHIELVNQNYKYND